jgi:proteasome lid subunit RPN8/RPN11
MRPVIHSIDREVIEMVNESARANHPNEFLAVLRAEAGVITEILLLPGTLSGRTSGILSLHMLPIDLSVVGTVHSHPSRSNHPSGADLDLFRRWGRVHIITCFPYDMDSWRAYDIRGEEMTLKVI